MTDRVSKLIRSRNALLALLAVVLILGIGVAVSVSLATGARGAPTGRVSQVDTSPLTGGQRDTATTGNGAPQSTPATACPGAHQYLSPEPGAPANGGIVRVGDKFVLDLMVHAGATPSQAQQAYL